MRTASALLVLAAILLVGPPPAQAQCELLSRNGICQSATPLFQVDFTPEREQSLLVPLREGKAVMPVFVVPGLREPIDCEMVRRADPSIDPLIVRRPPAGVKYTMRVIEVPACPVR